MKKYLIKFGLIVLTILSIVLDKAADSVISNLDNIGNGKR